MLPANEIAPAQEMVPANGIAPAQEMLPANGIEPAQEKVPAQGMLPANGIAIAQEMLPAKEFVTAQETVKTKRTEEHLYLLQRSSSDEDYEHEPPKVAKRNRPRSDETNWRNVRSAIKKFRRCEIISPILINCATILFSRSFHLHITPQERQRNVSNAMIATNVWLLYMATLTRMKWLQ